MFFSQRFLNLICICVFALGLSVAAQAQSLGLTPAYIDATVKRGMSYKQGFTISNNTNTRLRFKCFPGDYWYNDKNEKLFGRAGTLPRSASMWVQFTPSEIIVEANASATVNVVISVPQNAEGGYYTMPYFEGEPADAADESGRKDGTARATFAVRMGGLLMFAVEGASTYQVDITDGKINPPTASKELEILLNIKNSGNAHVRLRGLFAVLDPEGKLVGRGRIEEKRYLPGERNTLQALWGEELPKGKYTAIVTLTHDRAAMEAATLTYELPFEIK